MELKAFELEGELGEPLPRKISLRTRVFLVEQGRLTPVECQWRDFSFEDALDFDRVLGDTLQVTVADFVRGAASGFLCKVGKCSASGKILIVLEATLNGIKYLLFSVYEVGEEGVKRVYADLIGELPPLEDRKRRAVRALGLPAGALDSI